MSGGLTYAGWLASLDDAALTALLDTRPESLLRPVRSFSDLAGLLGNGPSVSEALRRLDRGAVQVAGVLGTLGAATAAQVESALARSGPVPPGHVDDALRRLVASALAWPDADRWQVPKAVTTLAPSLCGLGPPFRAVAERIPFYELRRALDVLDLGGVRSVADAGAVLGKQIGAPDRLHALLDSAPASVRAAVDLLATAGPQRALNQEAVDWLVERCLLLDGGDVVTVPAELIRLVRGDRIVGVVRVEPPPASPVAAAPVAASSAAAGAASVLALAAQVRDLLELLDRVPVKALQSGGIGVQEQRRLAKVLGLDVEVVRRLLHYAGDAGLLSTGLKPALVTKEGAAWLTAAEVPAAVELLVAAVEAGRIASDETAPLWGLPWHRSAPTLQQALASLLHRPGRAPLPWLAWRWYGATETELAHMVTALEQLGLVTSVGVQPWAGPVVAGDRAAAEAALAAGLPPEQDDVVLQADGTAVVAGRPSAALRGVLDRIAARESERTWRVGADRVRDALDSGATAEELLEGLRRHSRHPVPQVLEQLVRDVADRHGRIVVLPSATLLRVEDEPLEITLLRDKRLKALGLRQVQPGVLTSDKKPADVLAALRAAGHAPAGPAEPVRKRPAAMARRPASSYSAPRTSPSALVRALRKAAATGGDAPANVPLATVHPIGPMVSPRDQRFEHLPPVDRLLLARALTEGGRIEIDYVDTSRRRTTRVVEDLEDVDGLLIGWCELRDDERNFLPGGIVAVRPAR